MTLVYLAGAWLLGVLAAAASGNVWWPGVAALAAAGLAAAAVHRRPQFVLLGLTTAGLFVGGGLRYLDERPPAEPRGIALYNAPTDDGASPVTAFEPTPLRFRALVVDEPEVRGRSQRVRLATRDVFVDGEWQPSSGGVLLRRGLFPRHEYGEVLELEGVLKTPPSSSDFDYREYLARQGIVSLIDYPEARTIARGQGDAFTSALHDVRRRLGDALERALPEPHAALAQGLLLGQRSAIPRDLTADMNATGASHLVAISGYNVSLVAGLVIGGLAWLIGRRQAAAVALLAIGGYALLTGASPSVVRAAIMGGLFVIATLAGRPGSASTTIALAAAVMAGWEPLVVHDVSFQLSFAAVLGMAYVAPALQIRAAVLLRRAGVDTELGGAAAGLLEVSATTAAAVLATLPIIALNFERVSAVALVSNLLLVPAFPFILGASAITALAGVVWEPLGQTTGWLAWAGLSWLIEVPRALAALPFASIEVRGFGAGHAATAYLALVAFALWLNRPRPAETAVARPPAGPRLRPAWALTGALALATALAWWAALGSSTPLVASSPRLVVTALDVGQGDALLIETPDGRRVLVDGGPSPRAVVEELSEELPFWERTLDLVVLTHPQEDHLAGLIEVVERYDVRRALATPRAADTAAYREWRSLLRREGVPYDEARPGQSVDLGSGARLDVLAPGPGALAAGEANDASLVLKLSWGGVSFLLAGDIQATGEAALLRSGVDLSATVLKVAHHGAATSTGEAFLRAVRPSVAVVSVGEGNPFGHPTASVLERLSGALVLRTDEHGTLRLETDGRRLWADEGR